MAPCSGDAPVRSGQTTQVCISACARVTHRYGGRLPPLQLGRQPLQRRLLAGQDAGHAVRQEEDDRVAFSSCGHTPHGVPARPPHRGKSRHTPRCVVCPLPPPWRSCINSRLFDDPPPLALRLQQRRMQHRHVSCAAVQRLLQACLQRLTARGHHHRVTAPWLQHFSDPTDVIHQRRYAVDVGVHHRHRLVLQQGRHNEEQVLVLERRPQGVTVHRAMNSRIHMRLLPLQRCRDVLPRTHRPHPAQGAVHVQLHRRGGAQGREGMDQCVNALPLVHRPRICDAAERHRPRCAPHSQLPVSRQQVWHDVDGRQRPLPVAARHVRRRKDDDISQRRAGALERVLHHVQVAQRRAARCACLPGPGPQGPAVDVYHRRPTAKPPTVVRLQHARHQDVVEGGQPLVGEQDVALEAVLLRVLQRRAPGAVQESQVPVAAPAAVLAAGRDAEA